MTEGSIAPGTLVGDRFRLVRHLGDGGMATVWLARDERTGEDAAVKLLHRRLAFHAPARARMLREAEILTELEHPNIARCLCFDVEAARPFVVMERAVGRTLQEEMAVRIAEDRRFELHEVIDLLGQISSALRHAHRRGIVHRDLKPANVMIREVAGRLRIKLLDFGLARLLDQAIHDETTQGRRLGSLFYMSPEQARGHHVDERADVFALGTLLFELLTLRRAWVRGPDGGFVPASRPARADGANAPGAVLARMEGDDRPRPSAIATDLPPAVDDVVVRALAADPSARQESVEVLEREARDALGLPARRPAFLVPLGALMLASALMIVAYAATLREEPVRSMPAPEIEVGPSAVPRTVPADPEPRAERPDLERPDLERPDAERPDAGSVDRQRSVERQRNARPRRRRIIPSRARSRDVFDDLLDDLKADQSDPRKLSRLRDAIVRAARTVEDPRERTSIERLATSSAMLGDVAAMERLVARVRRAQRGR